MKIREIEVFPVWVGRRNQLIVRIESDSGVWGLGESGLSGRELAVAGAIKHYREFLLGRDPRRIGSLWQEMYRSQYFEGGRVLTAAISAIDIALHDLVAREMGIPVYQLLGGRQRDAVPCFATMQLPSVEEGIANARRLLDAGWTVIRVGGMNPPGAPEGVFEPWEAITHFTEALPELRAALGGRVVLGIDAHHRFSVAEAAAFCQRMPAGTLDFLEEPIRDESPEAYEALRSMTDVPFAVGEEFSSKWAFAPYIERGLTQYARIDVCNVGGMTESLKVAAMAETRYIDLMPHNPLGPICTAASVHLAAAVPNFAWLEMRQSPTESGASQASELFPQRLELEGDRIPVPDTPGLGVEFDVEQARKQDFQFWEASHLRRRDGSYTNW